jgi:hypothetical protein
MRLRVTLPQPARRMVLTVYHNEKREMKMYLADTTTWYLERLIRLFAGIFVLVSSLLGYYVNPKWFIFTGFVGAMLAIFALTGLCPMSIILHLAGARERCKC